MGVEDPDATPVSMKTTVTFAREARKQAELDAQMLANRIALLRQEEAKALKKIEVTRKKANEVKARQQAKQERESKRESHFEAKEMEIQKNLEKNLAMREANRAARDSVQRSVLEKNRERWDEIKRGKEDAKSRQAAVRASKYDGHRENYESKIAQEDDMKAQTEALIQRMEREEMELIQRLQNTHSVQQSAMAELESTIASA